MAVDARVSCDANPCTKITYYFKPKIDIQINSYIQLILPFNLYSETLTTQSIDGSVQSKVFTGNNTFLVNSSIPKGVWMKAVLTLTTAQVVQQTSGLFQFMVVKSTSQDSILLYQEPPETIYYTIPSQTYTPPVVTLIAPVIPVAGGTACILSNWNNNVQINKKKQLMSISVQMTANTTNERMNIQLTLNATPTGIIYLRQCYMYGTNLTRWDSMCTLIQNGVNIIFQIRASQATLLISTLVYNIDFYVSHLGSTITPATFTGLIYYDTTLVDTCAPTYNVNVGTTINLIEIIDNTALFVQSPNIGTLTSFGITFKPRALDYDTQIVFQLGFLSQVQPFCQVDTSNNIATQFSLIYYTSTSIVLLTDNKAIDNNVYTFNLNCSGYQLNSNGLPIIISYQDLQNTIISYAEIISPPVIPAQLTSSSSFQVKPNIILLSKRFNNPGGKTIFQFYINPTKNTQSIYVEFPYQYTLDKVTCTINGTETNCYRTLGNRFMIYTQFYRNQLVSYPFYLNIYGLINPIKLTYGHQIWVGLDDDLIVQPLLNGNINILNGIYEQQFIDDSILQDFANLTVWGLQFSQQNTRTMNSLLTINITAPFNTIISTNRLYLRIPETYYVYNLTCMLIKLGDLNKNNLITNCGQDHEYIQMNLSTDVGNARFSNSYQLIIKFIRTQDKENNQGVGSFLRSQFDLFFTDQNDVILLKADGQSLTVTQNLTSPKMQLSWYQIDSAGAYSYLQSQDGQDTLPIFNIYSRQMKQNYLFLGLSDPNDRFNVTFNLIIPQNDQLIIYGKSLNSRYAYSNQPLTLPKLSIDSLSDSTYYQQITDQYITINPGDSGYIFRVAAKDFINQKIQILANYTLIQPPTNSWNSPNYYNPFADIPLIVFQVQNPSCTYFADIQLLSIPIGGASQPIFIDTSDCIPIYETPLVFPSLPANFTLVQIQTSISMKSMEQTRRQTNMNPLPQYIFQITANDQVSIGTNFKLTVLGLEFTFTVVNSTSDANGTYVAPTNTALNVTYSNGTNQISLTMQCDQDGIAELTMGIEEIEDKQAAALTDQLNGTETLFKVLPVYGLGNYMSQIDVLQTRYDLIGFMYNNLLGDQLHYNNYSVQFQVNSSDLKSASYNIYNQRIQTLQIIKQSLSPKTREISLQRQVAKMKVITNQTINFNIINPQYDYRYSFGYYCVNQQGLQSSFSQNHYYVQNQTITNNLTIAYMLNITFIIKPSQLQINNILCSLPQFYKLNYHQVLSKNCTKCLLNAVNYTKINQTTYQKLVNSFVPVANRSASDQQKFTEGLYTLSIYLNQYPNSNGQIPNITKTVLDSNGTINITNILNVTDDLYLQYLYWNYTFTELRPIKRTLVQLATQLVLVGTKSNVQNLEVEIKGNQPILAFLGLHKIQASQQIKNPSGMMLRQGLLGTFENISQGVLFADLQTNQTTTLTFTNLANGSDYVLFWASSDLNQDCLTQQYSDTGVQYLTFINSNLSFGSNLVFLMIYLIM
ncbi:hypothetical protein pb186bvf_000101 [Paramecium bursaria]